MRVLLTGAGGQLATDLAAHMAEDTILGLSHAQLDIADTAALEVALSEFCPDVVVNTAAYHQVDRCETEPELSFLLNAAVPRRLATLCQGHGALLVHISTDYVFDGNQRRPYNEADPVAPLNVYGISKAAGEMAVRRSTADHLIVRTTGLFGHARNGRRNNFVETMLRLADRGDPISVVSDQVLTPSFTEDVAETIVLLIRSGARGTFHVTNTGECSWYEFAVETFHLAHRSVTVVPTTQQDRPLPALRPQYSVLGHEALIAHGLPETRPWQEGLRAYLENHV